MVEEKTFGQYLRMLWKKVFRMRTETEELKRDLLDHFGFKELTLVQDNTICLTQNLLEKLTRKELS